MSNTRNPFNVIQRMRWLASTGELEALTDMAFGSFRFTFEPELSGKALYAFLDFAYKLRPCCYNHMLLLGLYLVQAGLSPRVRFRWLWEISPIRNLIHIAYAFRLNRILTRHRDAAQLVNISGIVRELDAQPPEDARPGPAPA